MTGRRQQGRRGERGKGTKRQWKCQVDIAIMNNGFDAPENQRVEDHARKAQRVAWSRGGRQTTKTLDA